MKSTPADPRAEAVLAADCGRGFERKASDKDCETREEQARLQRKQCATPVDNGVHRSVPRNGRAFVLRQNVEDSVEAFAKLDSEKAARCAPRQAPVRAAGRPDGSRFPRSARRFPRNRGLRVGCAHAICEKLHGAIIESPLRAIGVRWEPQGTGCGRRALRLRAEPHGWSRAAGTPGDSRRTRPRSSALRTSRARSCREPARVVVVRGTR